MSLRIIGGELRRRHLKTPQGVTTRPYTDRVRQIVFDRLVDVVPSARVADIYAGVGTMGLESLSRGAASCVFFEVDRQVYQTLRENVDQLTDPSTTVCWKTDVRYTSFAPKGADDLFPYTLVYFDPPYAHCPMMEPGRLLARSLKRLSRPAITDPDVLVIVRTPEKFDLPELDGWRHDDCWHLSTMKIWSLRKTSDRHVSDDASPEESTDSFLTPETHEP